MPKVPQAVPMEKARKAAIAKTITGRNIAPIPEEVTTCCMNCGAESRSRQTPESVQARMRMMFAGSISFMPSTEPSANWANVISLRGTYMSNATIRAPKEANTSEIEAEELPMAAMKVWYLASVPQ